MNLCDAIDWDTAERLLEGHDSHEVHRWVTVKRVVHDGLFYWIIYVAGVAHPTCVNADEEPQHFWNLADALAVATSPRMLDEVWAERIARHDKLETAGERTREYRP